MIRLGLAVGAAVVTPGALVSACDGGSDAATGGRASGGAPARSATEGTASNVARPEPTAPRCNDLTGLDEQERRSRTNTGYTDRSPHPSRRCDNCRLFVAPTAGEPCGTCEVVAGPISAPGYCRRWAEPVPEGAPVEETGSPG